MTPPHRVEDGVVEVLRRQAEAIDVPPPPDLSEARPTVSVTRRPPFRMAAGLAAAAAVVVVGLVLAGADDSTDRVNVDTASPAPDATAPDAPTTTVVPTTSVALVTGPFEASTRQVSMTADSVVIQAGGRQFIGAGSAAVRGDPGRLNEYATLELTWAEHGVEMRLFVYFTSDGRDWWANEIRTYDGAAQGEWITYLGEYFRSALDSAYTGDFAVAADGGRLELKNLRLQAFLPPPACANPTGQYALDPSASRVVVQGGYGFGVTLLDAATCSIAKIPNDLAIEWSADDPSIVTVRPSGPSLLLPDGMARADLAAGVAGTTTVHVVARDRASGEVVAETSFEVVSDPSRAPGPAAAAPPPP